MATAMTDLGERTQGQVLARAWRPKDFNDVVGQEVIVDTLRFALDKQRLSHAYLFTGSQGIGKTSIARILAKCLNCQQGVSSQPCHQCNACEQVASGQFVDLIEIDAASRTKVEDTRALLENVPYAPTVGRYKVYLIDEVHMLSTHSFNALLKTLEEPPEHVIFLLATTDLHKLPTTVLSRCIQFNLRKITKAGVVSHLGKILASEAIDAESAALEKIADHTRGSLRDALMCLDQVIACSGGSVNQDRVDELLGYAPGGQLQSLLMAVLSGDSDGLYEILLKLRQMAIDYGALFNQIGREIHQLMLAQQFSNVIAQNEGQEGCLALATPEDLQLLYQISIKSAQDLSLAPDPAVGFEVAMLRMLAFVPVRANGGALAKKTRVTKAEERTLIPQVTPVQSSAPPALAKPKIDMMHNASETKSEPKVAKVGEEFSQAAAEPKIENDFWRTALETWPDCVERMQLQGLLRHIAHHSQLILNEGNSLELKVSDMYGQLLGEKMSEKLRGSLEEFLGKSILISVSDVLISPETGLNKHVEASVDKAGKKDEIPIVSDLKARFNAVDMQ